MVMVHMPYEKPTYQLDFNNVCLQWFRSSTSPTNFPITFDNTCFAAYRTKITTWTGSSNTANDYTVAKNISVVKAVTQSTVTVTYAANSYFLTIGY